MKLTAEHKDYMDRSVLCWLATSSPKGVPNVSPKEIFNHFGAGRIIIANIASPQTVRNIKLNRHVSVSFIDILVQKGSQMKGAARIIGRTDSGFSKMEAILTKMTGGNFLFSTITEITVEQVKPIIALKYTLYPETTEKEQIKSAKEAYGMYYGFYYLAI